MRERVTVHRGNKPVIITTPHGADDFNINLVALELVERLHCDAVINNGFRSAAVANPLKGQADCEMIPHLLKPVVYEEFFEPIDKAKNRILRKQESKRIDLPTAHIFHLFVCESGEFSSLTTYHNIDLIIGYGLGSTKDSLTCEYWRKNAFIDLCRKNGLVCYEGKGSGNFSGREAYLINQYYRKHRANYAVESINVYLPLHMITSIYSANLMGESLSDIITEYIHYEDFDGDIDSHFI